MSLCAICVRFVLDRQPALSQWRRRSAVVVQGYLTPPILQPCDRPCSLYRSPDAVLFVQDTAHRIRFQHLWPGVCVDRLAPLVSERVWRDAFEVEDDLGLITFSKIFDKVVAFRDADGRQVVDGLHHVLGDAGVDISSTLILLMSDALDRQTPGFSATRENSAVVTAACADLPLKS